MNTETRKSTDFHRGATEGGTGLQSHFPSLAQEFNNGSQKRETMSKKTAASPEFAIFLLGLEQKYGVSLDEILTAVTRFGCNRGKICGFFELQSYLRKNNLPAETAGINMVNRWFPG